jgi:hypothetical protein
VSQQVWHDKDPSLLKGPEPGGSNLTRILTGLIDEWDNSLDYGSYRVSNLEIGLMVGVTGQERMFTPP